MTKYCSRKGCKGELILRPEGYVCNVCGIVEDQDTYLTRRNDLRRGISDRSTPKMEARHTGKLIETEKSVWEDLISFSQKYTAEKDNADQKLKKKDNRNASE